MMKRHVCVVAIGLALTTVLLRAQPPLPPYRGKEPKEAAAILLERGERMAGSGSWERIAIAAVQYEGGDKVQGESVLQAVLAGKPEWSDYQRIGRLYADLGEWEKARPLFDKAMEMKKKASLYAEAGAWYYLNGDKEKGEALFDKAFATEADDPWAHAMAAAAYLGRTPRYW
jgi:tetratricopeptide (TPR) repeat protein